MTNQTELLDQNNQDAVVGVSAVLSKPGRGRSLYMFNKATKELDIGDTVIFVTDEHAPTDVMNTISSGTKAGNNNNSGALSVYLLTWEDKIEAQVGKILDKVKLELETTNKVNLLLDLHQQDSLTAILRGVHSLVEDNHKNILNLRVTLSKQLSAAQSYSRALPDLAEELSKSIVPPNLSLDGVYIINEPTVAPTVAPTETDKESQ